MFEVAGFVVGGAVLPAAKEDASPFEGQSPEGVLDHLHILANYEWDKRPLLSLVLVGLPELHDRMRLRKNRSLSSRIHTRLHLGEASPADTAEYVGYRLAQVRGTQDLFTSDAIAMLHEASGGRLRDIDRIAADSLKKAPRRKLNRIDREVVETAAGEATACLKGASRRKKKLVDRAIVASIVALPDDD